MYIKRREGTSGNLCQYYAYSVIVISYSNLKVVFSTKNHKVYCGVDNI